MTNVGTGQLFVHNTHSLIHTHRWLDSSKTLYEQDVKEHDVLYLRWKYYAIKDIDPRVRKREGGRERGRGGRRGRGREGRENSFIQTNHNSRIIIMKIAISQE